MKNIKIQELKRWLKSTLKNKVSISDSTIITFLMAGFIGISTITYSAWQTVYVEDTTGYLYNGSNRSFDNGKKISCYE